MTGKIGGPPPVKEVAENSDKITRARNLIQIKLSQLPSFIAITEGETGHKFNLESRGDQATLLMRFASEEFGWAKAFRRWENDMAESNDNRHFFAEHLDRGIFRADDEADHEALLEYFEVEALVIPFEKGTINLREIFERVKKYREDIYLPK